MNIKERAIQFKPIIEEVAKRHDLDPTLVAAVAWQESAFKPYAFRVEPAYWRRYGDKIKALARGTLSRSDDRWTQYGDVAGASYGLMQTMYSTAVHEAKIEVEYPTELCDPSISLEAGCRILKRNLAAAGGSVRRALLRYNGGGRIAYPDEVLAKQREVRSWGIFS